MPSGDRYIRCPACQEVFKWNYKVGTPREPVADPELPLAERRKEYVRRYRENRKVAGKGDDKSSE